MISAFITHQSDFLQIHSELRTNMELKTFLLAFVLIASAYSTNVGWQSYLQENPTEFHDLPLHFENGNATHVPSWLSGVFVRNGPGQRTFGSEHKHLSSYLDGFAKLHTFKLDGANVYFSGKMLGSSTYLDSVAKGELVPQIILNPMVNPDDEWSLWEMEEIMERMFNGWYGDGKHTAYDNNNPAVWRMGSKDNPVFIACTDYPAPQVFDIDTLESGELLRPANPQSTMTGIAHWMREPGTDNSITAQYKDGGVFGSDYMEVQRFTPDNIDYSKPEVIGTFYPHKMSMLHSFSITENYVIFLYSPVVAQSTTCLMANHFHVTDCIEVLEEQTDVFIVNLKTGEVQEMQGDIVFSLHHVNAYEKGDEIIIDLSPSAKFALRDYTSLENILNPPEEEQGINAAEELTRVTINPKTRQISSETHLTGIDSELSRYAQKFDFPTINEAYRGKEYCIIYGWSSYDYSRIGLVKKNVCDHSLDIVRYTEDHYPSEMYFIANPEGQSEDDGVLVTISYDGAKEQSYFMVIDAISFTEIDRAYLPQVIPWSAHGMHFPEAKWTLNSSQ